MSLLNSIVQLSGYPYEKIGIFLNDSVAPEVSSRFGMRIINNTWNYEIPQLNWGNFVFKERGAEPVLLNSVDLSGLYDTDYQSTYRQPYDYINIPDTFPLFFETSAVPGNHLLLTFRGGISAITIFPSTPYPLINQIDSHQFTVSGGLYSISATDQELPIKQMYQEFDISDLTDYSSTGDTIKFSHHSFTGPGSVVYQMYPDGYVSASRKDFVLKTQTNNSNASPLVNQLIPAVSPYSKGIVPESFQMTFTVSGANLEDAIDYTIGYGSTAGGLCFLSGINLQGVDPPLLKLGTLDAVNAKLNLTLNTGYYIPKGENYLVTYQASAVPYVKSTTSSFQHGISAFEGTNYYQISSQNAPYYYNYKFLKNADNTTAFTIYFEPELKTAQYNTSSFDVSAIMRDNFYQTEFQILDNRDKIRLKFVEENNDITLSAIDLNDNRKYTQNQWIPASAHLKFINDGIANAFTISPTISSFKDDIWTLPATNFILNREKANATLSITQFTENWAVVQGNIYPNFDSEENVTWNVEPSENIRIFDYSDASDLVFDSSNPSVLTQNPPFELDLDTPTQANNLSIIINNLGVDNTRITFYSSEFDLSASTLWIPPSGVYNNITLDLVSETDDTNPTTSSTISAYFIKNNMRYLAPNKGSVSWKETNNDPRGSSTLFQHQTSSTVFEDVFYPSTRNTNIIDLDIEVDDAVANPQRIVFNYSANVVGNKSEDPLSESYNLTDSVLIPVRQYPKNYGIFMVLSATDGTTISSKDYNSKFFLTPSLSASVIPLTSDFASIGNILWNIPTNTMFDGTSAIFGIPSSYCIEVSAISAKPLNGNFGFYNFTDKFCVNILPSSQPSLDYVSFPEYNMFPASKLEADYFNLSYLDSYGLTGLSACITSVTLSTFGGFDEYHYQIGTKVVSSTNNKLSIPIVYSDVSSTGVIKISAFSDVFPSENTLTIYNYVSSDNSSVFRQDFTPVAIPDVPCNMVISNDVINIRENSDFYIDLEFPYTGIHTRGVFRYILSSTSDIKYSESINFDTSYGASYRFTTNPSDLFSIKENTYQTFTLQVSGNIIKTIPGGPDCEFEQYVESNMILISAFDGPDLEIWTPHSIYTTNQIISVWNKTTEFPDPYTSFVFNDGDGHTTSGLTYSSIITASYSSEGTYSVSLTGVGSSNQTKTWTDFLVIKDTFDSYDSEITRTFPDDVTLPYQESDILIKPNEWQWNTTINDKFEKLYTNFVTLSALSYSWDVNVPKNVIGWLGEKKGKIRWNYETPPTTPYYQSDFTNLKDLTKIGNTWVLINDNELQFRSDDYNLTLLTKTKNITEGELFVNPTHVIYIDSSSKLVVLEASNKTILVFDVDQSFGLNLTHYWGGLGEKSSRTHLNNPSDLYSDGEQIYVVDSDSLNVKVYNNFLNWKNEITHENWTTSDYPISITSSDSSIYVLTSGGNTYVFDLSLEFVRTLSTISGNKIYHNANFLHIINEGVVYMYSVDGIFVNSYKLNASISRLFFDDKEVYGLNYFSIIKLIDYPIINDITDGSNEVSSLPSILVAEDEPVTDFVYNDSFIKLHNNLLSFAESITSKFVINVDEFDQFLNHEISSITVDEQLLVESSYEALGLNEIVSYETINRGLRNIWNDLELLRQMLDVRKSRIQGTDVNWTWIYHKIDKTQNVNNNRRPLSWLELATKSSRFSPTLSAINWANAFGGGYERNHMPVQWIWEQMGCNCIWPVTWEQMECGNKFGYTWEYLQSNCSFIPISSFNDCLTDCM